MLRALTRRIAKLLLTVVLGSLASVGHPHEVTNAKADVVPRPPGTYRLERIQVVPEGDVLDTDNRRARLTRYTLGRITLLSLIYTSCADANGCPMALSTLQKVRRDLEHQKSANNRVRLVTLSFDPQHDTPEVMRAYGDKQTHRRSSVPWYFLTTASAADLRPVLEGLGQDVRAPAEGWEASSTGNLSHALKVFLIDRDGWVREIYSSSTLVPQVIINDIQTLLIADGVKVR